MRVIGITGGIGSGKSCVANLLREKYGAYIINTDQIAKEQMEISGASYQGVVQYFGAEILSEDGSINRGKLAEIVFQDKQKLKTLNELTHPQVLSEVADIIQRCREEKGVSYLVIETALMIEANVDTLCDDVWYVYASEDERRRRLKESRNYPDDKIDSILMNQSKEEAFFAKYHKVIRNIGDMDMLEKQVHDMLYEVS